MSRLLALTKPPVRRPGPAQTLDLRDIVTPDPTTVEAWIRDRQVAGAGDIAIILPAGASVAERARRASPVRGVLTRLRHAGVVQAVDDGRSGQLHVDLAPFRAVLGAVPRRRRPVRPVRRPSPAIVERLDPPVRAALRSLAEGSLASLGTRHDERLVRAEMGRLYGVLDATIAADEPDRVARFRLLVDRALQSQRDGD